MIPFLSRWFSEEHVEHALERLRKKAPAPCIWLFGKTQSGKTSIVKFLTGAAEAEIGRGWEPCTRHTRIYRYPSADAPLLSFLDTRGLDEPGYDPVGDLAELHQQAHVILVVAKAMDHAQGQVREHLRKLRRTMPTRPTLLALTSLHEAFPQRQHPTAYPFNFSRNGSGAIRARLRPEATTDEAMLAPLLRSLNAQAEAFGELADDLVAIDLTRVEDGFTEPNYGGAELKFALLNALPQAYRQTLLQLDEAKAELRDAYAAQALPYILSYSSLAATAGALPIPWIDLLLLPAIQLRMVTHLGKIYGQPVTAKRFMEVAGTLGISLVTRQAIREFTKFIPFLGSVAGAALAGSSTFALGKAFCWYLSAVQQGGAPPAEELKRRFGAELKLAEATLFRGSAPAPAATPSTL